MTKDYETLVGSIYDSAADPARWPCALGLIGDAVDAAYVGIGVRSMLAGMSEKPAATIFHCSSSDGDIALQLATMIESVPDGQAVLDLPEDVSWSQLSRMQESEFRKTSFYRDWLKPQGLRDVLGVNSIKRKDLLGLLTMPTAANREPVTAENRQLVEQLSPHIRRAMTINDLTNNSVLALSLYRQVLDTLSVAVFIVGAGHRVVFTNAMGDALLSDGQAVFSVGGTLKAHRGQCDRVCALDTAIGHALAGEPAGHGVPLVSMSGEMIAAYVLPLAGRCGHCAVFVTQTGAMNAMAMDVLRGMFNLTVAEARVALLIAGGKGPQRIAIAQGIAMNTVRTHLKHIFSKMDVQDQTALAGLVTSLLPPVT
jgi:DNA-binding CsgD family transcriptional regulator